MKGTGSRIRRMVWWGFLTIFVFCGAWVAYYAYTAVTGAQSLGGLVAEVGALRGSPAPPAAASFFPAQGSTPVPPERTEAIPKTAPVLAASTPAGTTVWAQGEAAAEAETDPGAADALLAHYQKLHTENPDFIGWITIENTAVNYPVMHTPGDPQKYLHRDYEGRYSFAGLPFLDAGCDPYEPAANLIVYAHNMRSGQMFAQVTKYLDPDFLKAHPAILLDTLKSRGTYEVIAVLQIDLASEDDPSMLCYDVYSTQTQETVDALNGYIARYATIRAGKAQINDSILTLSTCRRMGSADRLVVIARSKGRE